MATLMILSGHNRVRAYTALLEKTGEDKYHRIPATVLTDISADEAHEIVVDSNYVQRVLTPSGKGAEHLPEICPGRAQKAQQERRAQIKV